MDILVTEYSLGSLFVLSFLAATLVPIGSEWLLIVLVSQGYDPSAVVGVATAGNTLGAYTTYLIGISGSNWLIEKLFRMDEQARLRAEVRFRRYGSWALLFAWLPIVGDPLCLAGGLLRVGWVRFVILVAAGKLARYAAVAWLTLQAAG